MRQRDRIIGWLLTPVSRSYVAVLFVLICFVGGLAWQFTQSAQHSVCTIQRRGLPAGHELAASMRAAESLLLAPRSQSEPPPTHREVMAAEILEKHLSAYLSIESRQPNTRSC